MYTNYSTVASDIICNILHGVWVEASFSLGENVIGWWKFKTTGETLQENVVVWQFAGPNNGILVGDCAVLDSMETENELHMKKQAEERILHRMAKVHDCLEMWQGSQNLRATQKEFHTQNRQMTTVWYISDTNGII